MPSPLPCQPADAEVADNLAHLKILSICHFVWGAAVCLFSCASVSVVHLGIEVLKGRSLVPGPDDAAYPSHPHTGQGLFLIAIGVVALLFGGSMGLLNLYSARCLDRQRRRLFSIVVAAFNCLAFPFGTVLGVFTLRVLLRPSVQQMYHLVTAVPTAYWPAGTAPPPPSQ